LGCEIDGRGEEDAVFEVWQEEVQFESISADKTAGVFGVEEVAKAAGVAPIAALRDERPGKLDNTVAGPRHCVSEKCAAILELLFQDRHGG
jgi:hypothetical protein